MKSKIFVLTISLSLLLSGMMVGVGDVSTREQFSENEEEPENYLENPSLGEWTEDDEIANWTGWFAEYVSYRIDGLLGENASVRSEPYQKYARQDVDIDEETTYYLEAWFRVPRDIEGMAHVRLEYNNTDGNINESEEMQIEETDGWQGLKLNVTKVGTGTGEVGLFADRGDEPYPDVAIGAAWFSDQESPDDWPAEEGVTEEIEASDITVSAGEEGNITVTAFDAFDHPVEGETIEVIDDDGLNGIEKNDTLDTDANGKANFTFEEEIADHYVVEFRVNNTEITDTSTVTVESREEYELEFVEAPEEMKAGTEAMFTIRRLDEFGNEVTDGDLIVELNSTSDETKYEFREEPDGENVTEVTILDGDSEVDFYYYDEYPGVYDIIASADVIEEEVNATITVHRTAVDYVEITPDEDQIVETGEELNFTARAYDEYGNLITNETSEFTWENISEVNENATFVKMEEGEYTVNATYEDDEYDKEVTSESITVSVADVLYYLNITIEGEGEVEAEPEEDRYLPDTNVTLTAQPAENWGFVNWTGDEISTNVTLNITMDENKDITAHFIREYNLTINIEGEGMTEPEEGNHTYADGDEVTLKATPHEDWVFIEWTGDYESEEEEIEFTMNSDMNITAVFKEGDEPFFRIEITDHDEEVEEGQYVTVEFTVENTGYTEDTQDITFSIGGTEIDKKEDVTLEAGEEESFKFFWEAEGGSHLLTVASEDDEDTVPVSVSVEAVDDEIPGFTSIILILGALSAAAIYYKKDSKKS